MNHLERLIAHMSWADRLVLDALRRASTPDPRVLEVYAHLLAAEHVWYSRLVGTAPRMPVWPDLSIEDCARLATEVGGELTRYAESLEPDDFGRAVTYRNSAGAEFSSTVEDIILHLCLHGAYHRGQITSALRGAGSIPNPTDYIAFIRGAPAVTRLAR